MEALDLHQGKDFRKTMVLPFMKMLERHRNDIRAEKLYHVLWEIYQESVGKKDFPDKVEIILMPYYMETQDKG